MLWCATILQTRTPTSPTVPVQNVKVLQQVKRYMRVPWLTGVKSRPSKQTESTCPRSSPTCPSGPGKAAACAWGIGNACAQHVLSRWVLFQQNVGVGEQWWVLWGNWGQRIVQQPQQHQPPNLGYGGCSNNKVKQWGRGLGTVHGVTAWYGVQAGRKREGVRKGMQQAARQA